MTAAEIADRLEAKKSGNGWEARCPAHEDKRASLSISLGKEGRTLIKCHVGCSIDAICASLGITQADLFEKRNGKHELKATMVKSYDYTDANGSLLYQVVRMEPKSFRQRRKVGGQWVWNMDSVTRVPYQLPEVIKAVSESRPVFICEGEKDVDAVRTLGFAATCNSGGAGKWPVDFGQYLKSAEVVIIADKDDTGRKHAQDVASKLSGHAASVRVIELPGDKVKDAHDWIAAGGQAAELDDMVLGVKAQNELQQSGDAFTWKGLLDFKVAEDPGHLIGYRDGRITRWLCKGYGAWLIGQSGIGKSSLMFQFGTACAAGLPIFGIKPARGLRVLVVQAENDEGDVAEMVQGIAAAMQLDGFDARADQVNRNIRVRTLTGTVGLAFCSWLRREIEDFRAELVLIDPLLSFAGCDLTRTEHATNFLRVQLDPVLRDTGCAMLAAHHTGKPRMPEKGQSSPTLHDLSYSGLGSSELVNWARAVMTLTPVGDVYRLTLAKRGSRAGATHPNGEPTSEVWLRHAASGIFWEQIEPPEQPNAEATSKKPKTKADMMAHVPTEGSILQSALLERANAAGISQRVCRSLLDDMMADGDVHLWLIKRKGTNPEKRIARQPQPA